MKRTVNGDLKWFGGWIGGCSIIIAIDSLQQHEFIWAFIFIIAVIYSFLLLWFAKETHEQRSRE